MNVEYQASHSQCETTPEHTMHSLAKTTTIYLIIVFIFVQLFHCIDTNNESVTMAVDIKETPAQGDGINTTETINIKQTTAAAADGDVAAVENITQTAEHRSAMEICNETFPTPKGTVC